VHFSQRLKKKLLGLAQQYLPYNWHYRPKRAFESSEAYLETYPRQSASLVGTPIEQPDGVIIHPILEAYSKLPVPESLFGQLSSYFVYDTIEKNGTSDPTFVATYSQKVVEVIGGRLLTNNVDAIAVITAGGYLLGDVSYQYHPARPLKPIHNRYLKTNFFRKPQKLNGTVFSMLAGAGATVNYGHWLLDALPRLWLLKQTGLFEEVDTFLVPVCKHDYHRDTLAMLGVPLAKIKIAGPYFHIEADRLIATTHPRGNRSYIVPDWLISFYRTEVFPKFTPAKEYTYSPFVYISRKDSFLRNVLNEEQVMEYLTPLGFKEYILSELPFEQKAQLFMQARVIVSASGAGLNNLLFCSPNAALLEIFPEGLVHTQYYNMAYYLGMAYSYMLTMPSDAHARSMKQGLKEHMVIDITELANRLEPLLAGNTLPAR
jgi:capsular polysaccharide biosynthesis protein